MCFESRKSFKYKYCIATGTVIIEGPSNVTYLPGLIPLPIELTCIVTGVAVWSVNGMAYSLTSLTNGAVPEHNVTGTNILVYSPVNNTEYVCISQTNDSETRSVPAYINIITGTIRVVNLEGLNFCGWEFKIILWVDIFVAQSNCFNAMYYEPR